MALRVRCSAGPATAATAASPSLQSSSAEVVGIGRPAGQLSMLTARWALCMSGIASAFGALYTLQLACAAGVDGAFFQPPDERAVQLERLMLGGGSLCAVLGWTGFAVWTPFRVLFLIQLALTRITDRNPGARAFTLTLCIVLLASSAAGASASSALVGACTAWNWRCA